MMTIQHLRDELKQYKQQFPNFHGPVYVSTNVSPPPLALKRMGRKYLYLFDANKPFSMVRVVPDAVQEIIFGEREDATDRTTEIRRSNDNQSSFYLTRRL